MTVVANLIFVVTSLAINLAAAYAAFRRGSVNGSGAAAGALVGTLILSVGGFLYWIMLMLFFVSSSLASRAGGRRKERLERMHERGSRRDAVQVFANGGLAALFLLALRITSHPALAVATAATFASVNADTWASEFGVLSGRAPRSIITGRRLEPGTSGGVSLLGTGAGAVGSLLIALWFILGQSLAVADSPRVAVWAAGPVGLAGLHVLLVISFAGLVGTTVDSILGATIQAQYRASDGSATERRMNADGPNERVRGLGFVNNDAVNFLSSLVAGVTAGAAWMLL